LQPGAEVARQPVELPEADALAHAVERRPVGVGADVLLEQLDQRAVFAGIDIGGNTGRVALQPNAIHGFSPPATDSTGASCERPAVPRGTRRRSPRRQPP